jgi:HK97 family phage major capsid protein
MYQEMLDRLFEGRARATGELQRFYKEAESRADESGRLTGEDQSEWEKRSADLDDFESRISDLKNKIVGEKQADEFRGNAEQILATPASPNSFDEQEKRIYDFFSATGDDLKNGTAKGPHSIDISLRGLNVNEFESGRRVVTETRTLGPSEQRTGLVDGTTTAGGFTFGPSFRTVLYQHLIFNSAMRQTRATILTTGSGENLLVPKTTSHPAAGTIVAEAAAIGEADPAFGQATLSAYKYGNIILVSAELEQDTQVDLLGYLAKAMGVALGNGMGADFVTGSGSSKPQGVLVGVGAATGTIVTGTSGTASAGANFSELTLTYDAIKPAYQRDGEWFMSQGAMQKLRALVNTQGTPIFMPSLSAGSPDMLFGHPIILDPTMPAPATSASSIAFGDFSTYFIRDSGSMRFERSIDRYFDTDQIAYRAIWRTDGRLVDATAPIAVYKGGTA